MSVHYGIPETEWLAAPASVRNLILTQQQEIEELLNHRGRTRPAREPREPPMLVATGIHQVLAWDITLLPGPVKRQFFYLYMVMDV